MQPIRIILDDAPENIHIPESLQHRRVEVIFWPLDTEDSIVSSNKIKDLDSACGILMASHSISLEQMDETIKKRGGTSDRNRYKCVGSFITTLTEGDLFTCL